MKIDVFGHYMELMWLLNSFTLVKFLSSKATFD